MGNYCTVEDVARFCNFTNQEGKRAVFGENPDTPSQDEVEEFITIAEEIIQDKTGAAWGSTFIQIIDEMYDFWCDHVECAVHLRHPNIASFDGVEGDKIEAWIGSTWKDWVADYTEGRNGDYWVDYQLGKIWFIRRRPPRGRQRLRITYRYNSGATVPGAIKLACALEVGVQLTNSEIVDILFPEGVGQDMGKNTMVRRWEDKIEKLLEKYKTTSVPFGTDFIPVNHY